MPCVVILTSQDGANQAYLKGRMKVNSYNDCCDITNETNIYIAL